MINEAELVEPTIGQCWEIYSTKGNVCESTLNNAKYNLGNIIRWCGLSFDDKASKLDARKLYAYREHLIERGYSPYSINTILGTVTALAGVRLKIHYLFAGFIRPTFEVFRAPIVHEDVVTFDPEQEKKVMEFMMECKENPTRKNKNFLFVMWFSYLCACRNGDICRMKWGNFVEKDDGIYLAYIPHKTMKHSVKKTGFRIPDEEWNIIKEFRLNDDEYILTDGCDLCKRQFGYLFKQLSRIYKERKIVVSTKPKEKTIYKGRRTCVTKHFAHGGFQEAHKYGMNNFSTELNFYIGNY